MIQPQTCLRVADNSGAKKLMCIRILGSNRRYGKVGDVIIGVVKDATPNLTVKRSDVVRAVIVRTKQSVRRKRPTIPDAPSLARLVHQGISSGLIASLLPDRPV